MKILSDKQVYFVTSDILEYGTWAWCFSVACKIRDSMVANGGTDTVIIYSPEDLPSKDSFIVGV